ncbi:MAG: filamentous hemagglutinin N-terminal domain-containing protein [Candidatus Melainabacteria bacterium]
MNSIFARFKDSSISTGALSMITQAKTCNSNPLLNWYQKLGSFCIGKFNGKLDFLHSLGIIGLSFIFLSVSNSVSAEPSFNALPGGIHDTVGISSVNVTGSTMNVNADASRSIANWQTFNVGSNATVNFNLPSSSSAILNRVTGGSVSEIFGKVNSNGQVFITNPSGILFGSSSQVNVGSLTASTLNINDQDFSNSKYIFSTSPASLTGGAVINLGNINATGSINLLGSAVHNQGNLLAPNINLAVGEKITLNIADGITSQVQIDEALKQKVDGVNEAIKNTGNIQGNNIHLQAQLEAALYDTLVNNEGVIKATGVNNSNNGSIELVGHTNDKQGVVLNSGKLEADNVLVVGDKTGLLDGSEITGREILIGGDYQGILSDSPLTLGEIPS